MTCNDNDVVYATLTKEARIAIKDEFGIDNEDDVNSIVDEAIDIMIAINRAIKNGCDVRITKTGTTFINMNHPDFQQNSNVIPFKRKED